MTQDEADLIISYLEIMENKTNHATNMHELQSCGIGEEELDQAAQALGRIAGRDYRII